jgi:hypothetical protein
VTSDVKFTNGTDARTVNVEGITWVLDPAIVQLQPATFRVLQDMFDDKLIPNFLIFFGKFGEKLLLDVNFPTDDSWKSFRKFVKNKSYFKTGIAGGALNTDIEWGSSGDAFNGSWEDTISDVNATATTSRRGTGAFGTINITKRIPSNTWAGTITWYFGVSV